MQKIIIDDWKSVFTNADTEDLPKELLTSLKNMFPRTGKAEKTFGFGDKFSFEVVDPIDNGSVEWDDLEVWTDGKYWIDSALTKILSSLELEIANSIATYVHSELICPNGSGIDYAYLAYFVNRETFVVSIKFWNGEEWKDIDDLLVNSLGSYYHKRSFTNPIIQANGIIRFLPGNVALADGTNESKGLWIGWIERDFFEGLYTAGNSEEVAAATKDYQKGFYAYDQPVEKPIVGDWVKFDFFAEGEPGESIADQELFLRYSYFYDGNQETLLSDDYTYYKFVDADKYLRLWLSWTKATHNKRITGLGIYQSDASEGTYYLAVRLDFTQKSTDNSTLEGSGGYGGTHNVYIPALSTYSFTSNEYRIKLNGAVLTKTVDNPGVGTGTTLLNFKVAEAHLNGDFWDGDWDLEEDDGGWASVASDSDGSYSGENTIILPTESMEEAVYTGGIILYYDVGGMVDFRIIGNISKAVHTFGSGAGVIEFSDDRNWAIYTKNKSNGFVALGSGAIIIYRNFWGDWVDGAAHPLLNEVSLKVNGKFAAICKGLLFKFNIILDPGGKNEVHEDWLSYSQPEQYDVNPVSNTLPIPDREGGPGTGLGVSFGSVILLKKHGIFKLTIVDPADPTSWLLTEAKFDRGNIAPKGYVQVGHDLYICSIDGAYKIDLNVLAASDDTPLIHNRISEPINDIYQALNDISEKPNIISVYDHINTEIIFQLTAGAIWAYNITTKFWREIDTAINLDAVCLDEAANPLIYDDSTKRLYSPRVSELVGMQLKTKSFRIGVEREEMVRLVTIAYRSASALTVNLYVEGGSTAVKTGTLPAASTPTTARVNIAYPCKVFVLEIIDSVNGSGYTDINKVIIE